MEYKKDYYGYVYCWTHCESGMKYIGSHYGSVEDNYIGSGKRFKPAYNKEPEKFKLEILEYVTVDCKKKLTECEQRFLDQVNNIRKNQKYYNLNNYSLGGASHITQHHIDKRAATLKEKHKKYGLSAAEKLSYKEKITSRLYRINESGFTDSEKKQHASYGYKVKVTDSENQIHIFHSLNHASRELGIDAKYGVKVCKTKSNFKGYYFEIMAEPKVRCSKFNDK